jgi:hypothetical protein
MFFLVGVTDPQEVAASQRPGGKPLVFNHSPQFAPLPEPSIKTGVEGHEPGGAGLPGQALTRIIACQTAAALLGTSALGHAGSSAAFCFNFFVL